MKESTEGSLFFGADLHIVEDLREVVVTTFNPMTLNDFGRNATDSIRETIEIGTIFGVNLVLLFTTDLGEFRPKVRTVNHFVLGIDEVPTKDTLGVDSEETVEPTIFEILGVTKFVIVNTALQKTTLGNALDEGNISRFRGSVTSFNHEDLFTINGDEALKSLGKFEEFSHFQSPLEEVFHLSTPI